MSHLVPESIKNAVMGSGSVKLTQLEANTQDVSQKDRITSDFGTLQTNTDDWLRVNKPDQIGPMLLEDGFAREKVCSAVSMEARNPLTEIGVRSTGSIMSAFLSVLSTLVALAHSESLLSLNLPRT